MIIGITGTIGSGKGTVVDFLLRRGFKHYSVREYLIEEILKRNLVVNRDSMVMVANDLRERNGPGYIVEQLYNRAKGVSENSVIESVRTEGEVETLKKWGDFLLFAVDADIEKRYKRIKERLSETDNVSFEEFSLQEQREMKSNDLARQNLRKCIEMADSVFLNNSSVEDLFRQVENALAGVYNRTIGQSRDDQGADLIEDKVEKEGEMFKEKDEEMGFGNRSGEGWGLNRSEKRGFWNRNEEKEEGKLGVEKEVEENPLSLTSNSELLDEKEEKYIRPTWDEYFFEIMDSVARRGTCDRGRSGAVIVKNKQILVTGYVGSPVGLPHCDDVGHQMKKTIHEDESVSSHCVRTAHAEQNAICQAAKLGVPLDGSTLYCKMTPCTVCAKMIINSGIKKVFAKKRYHQGFECEKMFEQAGVGFGVLDDTLEKYENM